MVKRPDYCPVIKWSYEKKIILCIMTVFVLLLDLSVKIQVQYY